MNELDKPKKINKGKQAIFYAMELTGFKPKNINKDSLNIILHNLINNHKDISVEKFRYAFELGVNGKLDIDLNTYQNFNTLYVSNVLQAYRRYKIGKVKREKFKVIEAPKKGEWSWADKKSHYEWLKELLENPESKHGGAGNFPDPLIAGFKDIYEHLVISGQIIEPEGKELEEKLKQAEIRCRNNNALNNIVKQKSSKTKTSFFYRCEVMDFMIKDYQIENF